MYPTISDFIKDVFGINIPLPIQSFGFMLAVSFFFAAWTLSIELRRKEKQGLLHPVTIKTLVGKPASVPELLVSFLIGFLIGFKLLFALTNYTDFVNDTQGILLSGTGSFPGGMLVGLVAVYLKYAEKKKAQLDKPEWKKEQLHTWDLVGNFTMVAAVAGILGAKIFHNLENLDELIADPVGSLLSFSGLTMYGGLIVGGIAVLWYARKNGINLFHLADATAPGLMLAYGTGRIGCQIAGDGDWGIVNLSPKPEWMSFLPDWFWTYTYPHNVIGAGVPIDGCVGKHCMVLPQPVFPTPLYEAITCIFLFFVLWNLRSRIRIPGMIFAVYLLMNGVERFFIERIRVNTKYHFGATGITQAQIISSVLIILGVLGIIWLYRKSKSDSFSK